MHQLVVERWSRGSSPLHSRDARAKLLALIAFLIAVSTTTSQKAFGAYAGLLVIAIAAARLPVFAVLRRAVLVLPFSATFALITWLAGEPLRALALAEKSFLSGVAALLLIATTPMTELMPALERLGVPRPLVLVVQFLYRYLFVLSGQAHRMRLAARARGSRFRSSAGALAVLFARSSERADGVYRAMLARGFSGRFLPLVSRRFGAADAAFVFAAIAVSLAIRLAI